METKEYYSWEVRAKNEYIAAMRERMSMSPYASPEKKLDTLQNYFDALPFTNVKSTHYKDENLFTEF